MKNLLITIKVFLLCIYSNAQTTSENYVKSTTFRVQTTDGNVNNNEKLEVVTYYDGLGRPKQTIKGNFGGSGEEVINPILYDDYGRIEFEYLPYSRSNFNLDYEDQTQALFYSNIESQYLNKYQEDFDPSTSPNPYSQKIYEASPLNRVKEIAAPGFDWKYDESNIVNIDYNYPIPLSSSFSINTDLIPDQSSGAQTLGSASVFISNNKITVDFEMLMQGPVPLNLGQIAYLDTGNYVIDGFLIGQLTDDSGTLIPYYVQIQNNYLVLTSDDPSYSVSGLNTNLVLDVNIPFEYFTEQKEESLNHTIRYEYGTNIEPIKHFTVDFVGNEYETELIYIEGYPLNSLHKTVVKDENWQPEQTINNKNNTTEEYRDKIGNLILKRTFSNNVPHDTYYVYDKYNNLTYVIPPLASDEIVNFGTVGFRVSNYTNYPWTKLVNVSSKFAEIYNRRLVDYNNKDLLNIDIENEYGGQGGFSISSIEDSDILTLTLSFSSNKEFELKRGVLISLDEYGDYSDTELGEISGTDYRYTFSIIDNKIIIDGDGAVSNINTVLTSNASLTYSKEVLWSSLMEVSEGFQREYERSLNEEAIENGTGILNTYLENEYGGQGGLNILIDENDILSLSFNVSLNTPLELKKGLVVPLSLKRRIEDRVLGSISDSGYDYYLAIKDNNLYINGYGNIANLNITFNTPSPVQTTSSVNTPTVQGLCYIYHYDKLNRLIRKKIPGKDWQFFVYDEYDRPILTQDGNMRLNNEWAFTKYDVHNREIYTGIYTFEPTGTEFDIQTELQNLVDNQSNPVFYESKTASSQIVNGTELYYSNLSFPYSNLDIHSIIYYDDYNFDNSEISLALPNTVLGQDINQNVKTYQTGSKIRVLGTNNWIKNIKYYDEKYRVIYDASYNEYTDVLEISEKEVNLEGKVLENHTSHTKGTNPAILKIDKFDFDHASRLKIHTQSIGGLNEELITLNLYDEHGELIERKVGGDVDNNPLNSNGLQNVNFTYNIRGWLKSINDIDNMNDDIFGFKLNYKNPEHSSSTALYNGNISESFWKTANDLNERSYSYNYDALNRITEANYHGNYLLINAPTEFEDYSVSDISYDKNGNIYNLRRMGYVIDHNKIDLIDNLVYNYVPNSNKLESVYDTGYDDGFKDDDSSDEEFVYDTNGNLTFDSNKGITNIEYNHLNLPVKIYLPEYHDTYTDNSYIEYTYDALGNKLSKKVFNYNSFDLSIHVTEYSGIFIYKSLDSSGSQIRLNQIQTAEGYLDITNLYAGINSGEYVYQFKDHLGNIRLSYSDKNDNGEIATNEIIDENNYYPFGLEHKGYNYVVNGNENPYKTFQGQEISKELGYNMLEFKYRHYDPAIARFVVVDPLTEDYMDWGPYVFSGNRVIDARELEGLEPYVVTGRSFIPDKSLPNPKPFSKIKSFAGDDRSDYQLNTTAYRTEQKVRVDFEGNKATTLSNRANSTVGYDENGNVVKTSESGKAGRTPTYTMEDGTATVNMEVDASNKLASGAPAINYDVSVTITKNEDGSFSFKLEGESDGFPGYEFFITNEKDGKSYQIYGSNPNETGDGPWSLWPPMEKDINASGSSSTTNPVEDEKKK